MRAALVCLLAAGISFAAPSLSAQSARGLDLYVIDVEGGTAVLVVAPTGESVLIDGGNGAAAKMRDADRIMSAINAARLTRLDYVVITHWHRDHFGALDEIAARIPVKAFVDHGPNVQPNADTDEFLAKVYPGLIAKSPRRIVKPGDTLSIPGVEWHIVTAAGQAIKTPLNGAGQPNPACGTFTPQAADATENAQSIGSALTFGRFRVVFLGDLTWNKEFDLMCPRNLLGTADLFLVSHHGQSNSNSPVLVHGIQPRVAIMNNGPRKGGQPETMKVLFSAPALEDLWQSHFSLLSGQEFTTPGTFIANAVDEAPAAMPIAPMTPPDGFPPQPAHNGTAHWLKVSAQRDGAFTVTNQRNGFAKTYSARTRP